MRIKRGSHRWQGETWYYGPCGKRMKQFPEVIKYLSRNVVHSVRREHFSFSPRMPVGDFFEERDTPEGLQWVQLSAEEIPSRIQAITGRRGRPRNSEKSKDKDKEVPRVRRGRGRPPKVQVPGLLTETDNRLPKKLETQETLSEEDKAKMTKSKKKMRQKVQRGESQPPVQGQARNKRKQDTKSSKPKDTKRKFKAEKEKMKTKQEKLKEKVKREKKEKVKAKGKEEPRARPSCRATQRRLEEQQRQQVDRKSVV